MRLDGQIIGDGRYRLDRPLGSGGMGVVYAAFDLRLEVPVAIKFLSPFAGGDDALRARLWREAQIQSRLNHSSICRVFDFLDDGEHFGLVMDHLDGETFAERIERTGPIDLATLWSWMMPLLEAIEVAHRDKVVHRDLKSSNVMLVQEGSREIPKLLDFGIAKLIDENRTSITSPGGAAPGTPQFMAPEQLDGGEVDGRADVYAIGVMMYHLTTGRLPFPGSVSEIKDAKRRGVMPAPPSSHVPALPQRFDDCVLYAMAPDPARRFKTVLALVRALDRAVGDALPEGFVIDTGPFSQIRQSNHALRAVRPSGPPWPVDAIDATAHRPGEGDPVAALGPTVHPPGHASHSGDGGPTRHRGDGPTAEVPGPTEHPVEPAEVEPAEVEPAERGAPAPTRRRRRRPVLWLALALLVGGALTAGWQVLATPACAGDAACAGGSICDDGRCRDPAESAAAFYRGVIDAYNERDRAAYRDAWSESVPCFWRGPYPRDEIARMRSAQFDEGGRRIEIRALRARVLGAGRVELAEAGLHHKLEGSDPVERTVVVERGDDRWRIIAEARSDAKCLPR